MNLPDLLGRLKGGDKRAVARLISWVERRATAAKASLISTRSRSAGATPARRQASAMARDGWECRLVSGPATDP